MSTSRIGLTDFSRAARAVLAATVAALLMMIAALAIGTSASDAAISGQLEAWNVEFGTEPGQLFNPAALGVDPVDGSVYILSQSFSGPEARIEKFSPTGEFKGEISIPRAAKPGGSEFQRGFVGIAVDRASSP